MLNLNEPMANELEFCVRNALHVGELSPAAQQHIQRLVDAGNLSSRDFALLAILSDAIEDGCIHKLPMPTWR